MHSWPFTIRHNNLPKTVNIIIIGGGLSGLQLAFELFSQGVEDVLVIEAGDWVETQHVFEKYGAEQATKMWIDPSNNDASHWRPWISKTPNHYTSWSGLRRKVGGRSLYWHGVCIRIEPWALNDEWWPLALINDLTKSWNGGDSLYSLWENEIDLWRKFPFEMKADDSSVFSPYIFQNMGYTNSEIVRGMVRHKMFEDGKVRFSAYTPLELWTLYNEDKRLPKIASGCYAQKTLIKNNRAKGVAVIDQATKQIKNVFANTVILASGTIENSRLVIQALSDIRKNKSYALTRLVDHIVQGFIVKIPQKQIDPVLFSKMRPGPLFLLERNFASKSNLFAQYSYDENNDLIFEAWSMGEQIPNEENHVKCYPDREMPWKTSVKAILAKEDIDVINGQKDNLQNLWNNFQKLITIKDISKISFVEFNNPAVTLRDVVLTPLSRFDYFVPVSYASYLGTVDHESGTIGFNKLIDERNQFFDLPSLYAVGPCTFPRIGAANPSLTSLALVRRLANIISS